MTKSPNETVQPTEVSFRARLQFFVRSSGDAVDPRTMLRGSKRAAGARDGAACGAQRTDRLCFLFARYLGASRSLVHGWALAFTMTA